VPDLRAVVFDLDGLLVNTEELYHQVGSELLRRRGHEFLPDLLDKMMGRPQSVALRMMIEHHALDATVEQLAQETEEIFRALLDARLRPMPGAAELLAALEGASIPKAIATSSSRRFASDILNRLGWLARFQFLVCGDEVEHGKPQPDIYLAAARQLNLQPAQVLVLEDSQTGCRAAIAAGAFAVGVPAGHSRTHDFSGASLIADTLADARIYSALGICATAVRPA
jgi:HAD superfamily hydrolase (TIGR01509 family)